MQQKIKRLYVSPCVKVVKFQVESGFQCSVDDCTGQEMKSMVENYELNTDTVRFF